MDEQLLLFPFIFVLLICLLVPQLAALNGKDASAF